MARPGILLVLTAACAIMCYFAWFLFSTIFFYPVMLAVLIGVSTFLGHQLFAVCHTSCSYFMVLKCSVNLLSTVILGKKVPRYLLSLVMESFHAGFTSFTSCITISGFYYSPESEKKIQRRVGTCYWCIKRDWSSHSDQAGRAGVQCYHRRHQK